MSRFIIRIIIRVITMVLFELLYPQYLVWCSLWHRNTLLYVLFGCIQFFGVLGDGVLFCTIIVEEVA